MLAELYKRTKLIQSPQIRTFTDDLIACTPEMTWRQPASVYYHPKEEQGEWGNLIHTIKVDRLGTILADISKLDTEDCDVLHSACLLHDSCRRGLEAKALKSVPEHPYLVRRLAEQNKVTCSYADEIFSIIENHMGRWGAKPHYFTTNDGISLSYLLHLADCIVTRYGEVWKP